jgi:hypothetical protein
MKTVALGFAAIVLAACAAPAPRGPVAFPLANAGFEQAPPAGECAPGWTCVARKDPRSFRVSAGSPAPSGGERSLCVEPAKKDAWVYVTHGRFDASFPGRRMRFSLEARLDGVAGRGAGARIVARDGRGKILQVRERLITGSHDWQTLAVEMEIPPGAVEVDVGGLLDGSGRLCIDNARAEIDR